MDIMSRRFGALAVQDGEKILFSQGLLGFSDLKEFVLVDPGDDTLILWLQSLSKPEICLPVLEPRVFKPDYLVRLSAVERKDLGLERMNDAAVLCVLTIPTEIYQMTANLKAPLVINLRQGTGRQVVLQENEYLLKHPMFTELRAHLLTIQSAAKSIATSGTTTRRPSTEKALSSGGPIPLSALPACKQVRALDDLTN